MAAKVGSFVEVKDPVLTYGACKVPGPILGFLAAKYGAREGYKDGMYALIDTSGKHRHFKGHVEGLKEIDATDELISTIKRGVLDNNAGALYCPNIGPGGCDPEVFVVDKDGAVVPAFRFLPDKKNALESSVSLVGGNVQYNRPRCFWDGFQAEFTTTSFNCHGWAGDYIYAGLKTIYDQAKVELDPMKRHRLVWDLVKLHIDQAVLYN